MCHFFVLTTFWRHLWSITEQTYSNLESICWIDSMLSCICSVDLVDHRRHQNVVRKNKVAHKSQLSMPLMHLTYFDIFSDLLFYRPMATVNICFFLMIKKLMVTSSLCLSTNTCRSYVRSNQNVWTIQLIILRRRSLCLLKYI